MRRAEFILPALDPGNAQYLGRLFGGPSRQQLTGYSIDAIRGQTPHIPSTKEIRQC
jgi:hypothetical protein